MNKFIKIGISLSLISIILGAFGAHMLQDIINPKKLLSFNTGVKYQMLHGISILLLSFNQSFFSDKLKIILKIMTIGIILFSLSIYLLSLQSLINTSLSFLSPITPIGGILLIISWIMLLLNVNKD